MPWCPKCKSEYQEGYNTCQDCGQPLVDTLPEDNSDEYTREVHYDNNIDWVLFKNLYPNDREGDIIISILDSNDIPVLKKMPFTGEYTNIVMGRATEIQIFVPSNLIDKAQALIEETKIDLTDNLEFDTIDENLMDADDFLEDEDKQVENNFFMLPYKSRRNIGIVIIIVVILFPLVFFLINKAGSMINGINIGPIKGPRP